MLLSGHMTKMRQEHLVWGAGNRTGAVRVHPGGEPEDRTPACLPAGGAEAQMTGRRTGETAGPTGGTGGGLRPWEG